MSFSSVETFLNKMGVTNQTATDEQRESALIEAFWAELPDGMNYLKALSEKAKTEGRTVIGIDGHTEQTIKDCQRLVGNTIPRRLLEKHFGVPFESYNCHYPVTAPDKDVLQIDIKTQIDLQNGTTARPHC